MSHKKIKVYNKRGNTNYKEKKLVKELRAVLSKKISESGESFMDEFQAANDFEGLKKLHEHYCSEEVDFQEIGETSSNDPTETSGEQKTTPNEAETMSDHTAERSFLDPFNRDNPHIEPHVLGDSGYADDDAAAKAKADENATKTFDEPTSHDDAFSFDDTVEDEKTGDGSQKDSKSTKSDKKEDPVNPDWEKMNNKKKRRSTKRFAKHIVNVVCNLQEKGFVWYANKDINDAKLAEYEVSGEIDLTLLVTLENNQEITVKEFFQQQCKQAEEYAIIDKEDREDATEALYEVLMEKGVAPTPSQELLITGLNILGGQALLLLGLKSQTNSLLRQLRSMNEVDDQDAQEVYEEQPTETYKATEDTGEEQFEETQSRTFHENPLIAGPNSIETKE